MKQILITILILILIGMLYYVVLCINALCRKIHHFPVSSKKNKIAVLIPARDEEAVIGNLIQSLQQQNYPRERYDIYVLINGCTDHTESISIENGAKVMHFDNVASKGEVLEKTFQKLEEEHAADAYIILDADNLADQNFLTMMNDAYSNGCNLIQGRRTGKNKNDSWVSNCYEIFYILQNIYFNHSRTVMGRSGSFNGTALLISSRYLQKYGYKMYTMTEDLELMAVAALNNEKIYYSHDAIVYDEYPVSQKVAFCQLKRWIFGQVQCMRKYAGRLLKKSWNESSSAAQDTALVFLMPILFFTLVVLLILWLVNVPAAAAYVGSHLLQIILILFLLVVITLNAAVRKNGSDNKEYARGVLYMPVFAFMWLIISPVMLFKKQMTWEPIVHDVSKRIEEMK